MSHLAGRSALITGGAGSIGLATARPFVREGANVLLVDLEADALARAVAELARSAPPTHRRQGDGARGDPRQHDPPGPIDNAFQAAIEVEAIGAPAQESAAAFNARIPLGRHATAAEIAEIVLFLASDESSFITGATIAADGGLSV